MADLLDVLTLPEGRTAIGVTTQDDKLAPYITAISRFIDDKCGPVVVRTVTDEVHDGTTGPLFPRKWPVQSVTTVKEYQGTTLTTLTAESVSSQTTSQFYFDSGLSAVWRRSGGYDYPFTVGRGNILITYVAGRYADTASVDPKFKLAASLILLEMWRPASGAWAQSADPYGTDLPSMSVPPWAALPKAARDLLGSELLPPSVA